MKFKRKIQLQERAIISGRSLCAITLLASSLSGFAALPTYGQNVTFEEIVVTSRKRSENLQDVPVSVDAFSADTIEKANIGSMRDYIGLSANLTITETQNTGFAFINIRGLSQVRNVDPSVAVVIDGVLSTTPLGFSQDMYDVQQIEVLKGPQGALYGRNASGGAINITTKQPSDEVEGYIRAGYGNGQNKSASASISGPLIEGKLLGRVSVSYKNAKGWRENITLREPTDPYKDISVRGKLMWIAKENVTVDLRYAFSRTESKGSGFAVCSANFVSTGFPSIAHTPGNGSAVPLPGAPAAIASQLCGANNNSVQPQGNIAGFDQRIANVVSLKIDWESDFGTFTSVSSYDDLDAITVGDQFPYYPFFEIPPGPAALGSLNAAFGQNRFHKAYSQEFRFTSAQDKRFRWIVGAYYVKTDLVTMLAVNDDLGQGFTTQRTEPNTNPNTPTSTWNRRFFAAAVPALGGNFAAAVAANPNTNPGALSFSLDSTNNQAFAFFAQSNYDLTDTLELSFALRYDRDERKLTVKTPAALLPVFSFPSATNGEVRKKTYDSLQPKLTLRWKPKDDMTVYATYAQGFRSGGFNLSGVSVGVAVLANVGVAGMPSGLQDSWDQEDTESFELGFKSVFMDGSVRLNAAAFFTRLDNAFNFNFVAPFNAQTVRNIDKSEIAGFELNISWLASEYLTFDFDLGLMDSEIKKSTWAGAAGIDIIGNTLPQNPSSTINLSATYERDLTDNWAGYIRTDYRRIGRIFFEVENFSARNPINLVSINVGLNNSDNGWNINAWVKNLLNENYASEVLQPPGLLFYAKLRQFGLNITKRF